MDKRKGKGVVRGQDVAESEREKMGAKGKEKKKKKKKERKKKEGLSNERITCSTKGKEEQKREAGAERRKPVPRALDGTTTTRGAGLTTGSTHPAACP